MKWLQALTRWNLGFSLLLFNWSTSLLPLDCHRRCLVRDVLMPNRRYSTVVIWLDSHDSRLPRQETPCTNSDSPSTSGLTTNPN